MTVNRSPVKLGGFMDFNEHKSLFPPKRSLQTQAYKL